MQTPETIVAWTFGVARLSNAANQPFQIREIRAVQNPFLRAHTKHNFRFAPKTRWLAGQPCPRKFQAMTAEGNLGGRHDSNFNFRHQRLDQRHWGREARKNFGFVRTTHQPGRNISAIGDFDPLEFFAALL